jgi:hypothetical protein
MNSRIEAIEVLRPDRRERDKGVRCGDVLVRIENRTLGEKGNADGFAIKLEENDEVGWDLRLRRKREVL